MQISLKSHANLMQIYPKSHANLMQILCKSRANLRQIFSKYHQYLANVSINLLKCQTLQILFLTHLCTTLALVVCMYEKSYQGLNTKTRGRLLARFLQKF